MMNDTVYKLKSIRLINMCVKFVSMSLPRKDIFRRDKSFNL